MRSRVNLYINDQLHSIGADKAGMMLADYLRDDLSLTGTKVVCAEGDCGACSVLRFFPHPSGNGETSSDFLPINSCITPVAILDGSSLVTVEALQKDENLHEAQTSLMEAHGTQCGYCTPGIVVSLAGLCEKKLAKNEISIDRQEAKNCLTGNLCRCTGYDPIIDAACKVDVSKSDSLQKRFFGNQQKSKLKSIFKQPLSLESESFKFYAPKTLKDACLYLERHPAAQIIASSTDLGVVHNKRRAKLTHLLSLHLIEELYQIQESQGRIRVGARVTISELRTHLKNKIEEFANFLDLFASPQIKNIATLVGNIANASPIGDTPPALLALDARLVLESSSGIRTVEIDDFFKNYRKTALKSGELISSIDFKVPEPSSCFKLVKNSIRKDLDISSVNLAVRIDWSDHSELLIDDVVIAVGGVAAVPIRLKKAENFMKLKNLNQATIDETCKFIQKEFTPLSDVRGTSSYRRVVVEKSLKRIFANQLTGDE